MSKFSDKINNLPKTKKIRYLVLLAIVLLIAVSLVIIFWYSETVLKKTQKPTNLKLTVSQTTLKAISTELNSGYEEAVKVYDEQINLTSNDTEKQTLMMSKSALYYDQKNYAKALEIALQADNLVSDQNSNQFIAKIYQALGEKQKAIDYYKKAITLITPENPLASFDRETYQNKINELQKT